MASTRRFLAGVTTIATAGLGLGLAAAGPAAAAETGSWHAYGNTNPITSSSSTWQCAGSRTVTTDVIAQVCAIRSPGLASVQAAVIVRNNRTSLYSTSATMDLYTPSGAKLGDWACASSGVGAHSWSVCFGRTLPHSGPVNSAGYANGRYLGLSSDV